MIPLNLSGISEELKRTCRWVLWQLEDVQDGEKLRKNMKPPYDAKTGERAKHNDFSTWTTYDIALKAHESNLPLKSPSTTLAVYPTRGLGCVIGKPFFGIDIDDCRHPETGEIEASAQQWIKEANSYTEISPSGTGVHIWAHGEPPYPEGHRKNGREIYSTNRYLTITGAVLEGHEEIRRFTPSEVKEWYNRVKNYGKDAPANPATKITTSSTTEAKIAELMVKTDYPDLSPMVQSLLTLLAIKYVCDPVKVEEEFKKSAIYNETHWKEKWDRLGKGELEKALAYARENLQKRTERYESKEVRRELIIEGDEDGKRTHLKYLWEPVLPLGKLCHFGGASSQGKSPVTMDIIARITTGREWPDGQPNTNGPKKVILFNIEDSWEDTILPRYDLAGGAKGMLKYIRGVKVSKAETFHNALVAFDQDIHLICEYARTIQDLGAIFIDPITNYLGKLKMNAEEDVRQVLTPLAGIAEELGITVVTVGHLNKNENQDPLQRMMGAAAFSGVARSVYMFGPDEKATDPRYAHVIAPVRGNMEVAFKYHTEVVEKEWDGEKSKIVRVVWDGKTDRSAEEILEKKESRQQASEKKKCAEALHQYLMSGKQPASTCKAFLKENGWDIDTLNSGDVRKLAGVESKQKDKKWWWFLPTNADLFTPTPAREKRAEELKKDDAPSY